MSLTEKDFYGLLSYQTYMSVVVSAPTFLSFNIRICWEVIKLMRFSRSKAPAIVQSGCVGCVCVEISCLTCAHHALFVMLWALSPLSTCPCSTILLQLYHLLILVFSGHPLLQICICMLSRLSPANICLFYQTGCDDAWWKGHAHSVDCEPAFSDYQSWTQPRLNSWKLLWLQMHMTKNSVFIAFQQQLLQ